MDLPQQTEDYIRQSIDYCVGLPVSTDTLQLKLRVSEETKHHLQNQCFFLQSKLQEKDNIIDRARAEASLNAQALKKFVDENQKLAVECADLLAQCKKWEKECSLYDHDREALMDFGNEADSRAKEAEVRVQELEEKVQNLSEELQLYKHQSEAQSVGPSTEESVSDQVLLESLLCEAGKDEVASIAHSFLEANCRVEVCQRMLTSWKRLRPFTQKVLALIAQVKALENDKEHLKINLNRAEEEAKVLFEDSNVLDLENKELLRHLHEENQHNTLPGSREKQSSSSTAKGNKRKSCSMTGSNNPVEEKTEFSDIDSARRTSSS